MPDKEFTWNFTLEELCQISHCLDSYRKHLLPQAGRRYDPTIKKIKEAIKWAMSEEAGKEDNHNG
jgi:hypothetical protein